MKPFSRRRLSLLAVALTVWLAAAAPAAAQSGGDQWRFSIMPYLWLPTIDGTLKFKTPNGNPEVDLKANPGDYLSDLDMALLLALEARKGKWLVFSDVTYMKLSGESSSVRAIDFGGPVVSAALNANTQSDMYSTIWTVAGGYNFVQDPKVSLDLIGGARYLHLKSTTN